MLFIYILFVITSGSSEWRKDPELEEWLRLNHPEITKCSVTQKVSTKIKKADLSTIIANHVPVVLRGVGQEEKWPALKKWKNKNKFKSKYGNTVHETRWPFGARQVGILARNSTIGDFIDNMDNNYNHAGVMFSAANNSIIMDKEWGIPKLFGEVLHSPLFSLSMSKEGLAFHNHGSAWESVVVGRKLFLFLPPLSSPPPPDVISLLQQAAMFVAKPLHFIKHYWKSLRALLQPLVCILEPGDAVYIPCNMYHMTFNIGDTMAVGGSLQKSGDNCPRDIHAVSYTIIQNSQLATESRKNSHFATESTINKKKQADLYTATKVLQYNVEANIKYGVLLAQQGHTQHALKWFQEVAERFINLSDKHILDYIPLAVIIELLAEYVVGVVSVHSSGEEQKEGYEIALQLGYKSLQFDKNNKKAIKTTEMISKILGVELGSDTKYTETNCELQNEEYFLFQLKSAIL
eukprot:m.39950 g.39950  ORF g.39950 m.39950 type:complete len:462 (+) comp9612_c0_seq2:416-1801(+)